MQVVVVAHPLYIIWIVFVLAVYKEKKRIYIHKLLMMTRVFTHVDSTKFLSLLQRMRFRILTLIHITLLCRIEKNPAVTNNLDRVNHAEVVTVLI